MTDRLSNLLHDAAATLDTPSLSAGKAMSDGRRLRLRRRARGALAGAAAVAVVAVGASFAAAHLTGDDHAVSPADRVGYEQQGAWAVGNQVHIGDHAVEIPGSTGDHRSVFVGAISYTSVGALVPYTDLSAVGAHEAPRTSVLLVTPNGDTRKLGQLDGWASDPGSSVIVYPRTTGKPNTWQLVTLDLTGGGERSIGTPWHATSTPEVSMSGDLVVYVREQHMVTTDWRTGEPGRLTGLPEVGMTTMQSFGHGGYLTAPEQAQPTSTWHLRGLPGGNLLGTFPDHGDGQVQMSPDGRFVMTGGHGSVTVYAVDSGKATALELTGSVRDFGWTPDGHVLGPRGPHVAVCDPSDGSCSDVGDLGGERLSVGHGASDTDPMAGG